jgi:hypothetical protein
MLLLHITLIITVVVSVIIVFAILLVSCLLTRVGLVDKDMDGVQGRGTPHDGGLRDGAETHQLLLALLHLRFDPVAQILSPDLEVQPCHAEPSIECIWSRYPDQRGIG